MVFWFSCRCVENAATDIAAFAKTLLERRDCVWEARLPYSMYRGRRFGGARSPNFFGGGGYGDQIFGSPPFPPETLHRAEQHGF